MNETKQEAIKWFNEALKLDKLNSELRDKIKQLEDELKREQECVNLFADTKRLFSLHLECLDNGEDYTDKLIEIARETQQQRRK